MTPYKIPQTDSVRELAQFWDTHDLTDFEDQLEEVTEPVFEHEKVVKIRLTTKDAETVESIARTQGVNPADLSMNVVERCFQRPGNNIIRELPER